MPTSSNVNAWATQSTPINLQNGIGTTVVNSTPPPPVQDKYAALKDLDNEMKQQQNQVSNLFEQTVCLYNPKVHKICNNVVQVTLNLHYKIASKQSFSLIVYIFR